METFKIRSSQSGKLMTNPRSKKARERGDLSKTTISYIEQWVKEQIYGVKKQFSSKEIEKGIRLEDEAIDKAIDWLNLPMTLKNEQQFEDDWFTGEPDLILDDEIIDIKCSYDCFSFPLLEKDIPTKDYYYQLQVYMHLTGKRKARLVYVLLNTPEDLVYGEPEDYSNLDSKYRIKTFDVEFDPEVIETLKQRVEKARKIIENNYSL